MNHATTAWQQNGLLLICCRFDIHNGTAGDVCWGQQTHQAQQDSLFAVQSRNYSSLQGSISSPWHRCMSMHLAGVTLPG